MAETTGDTPVTAETTGRCHWHKGPSDTLRLVRVIEQNSGPGYGQYACGPCRDQHRLVPLDGDQTEAETWRVYIQHIYTCKTCSASHRCDVGQPLWDTHRAARAGVAVAR